MNRPGLDQLLGYERHLEGEAFTRNVLAAAAQRRRSRRWILLGSAAVAAAATLALKPEKFTFLSNIELPQGVSESVAALPVSGLLAMLLVSLLVVGISKTVDSI
ncbi:hypothetical protein [Lysobacter enzymogenes]|uniref:hypothetical protein n=1 Tax=Lysobacter enzymogenes TaxID=69 RepID=UPI001A95ED30|nr:hypothetical protein [Lysobacter enzymogenes]QQP97289.1 hypothetical protein JHW38_04360 [Lysobacter enzymogenes]